MAVSTVTVHPIQTCARQLNRRSVVISLLGKGMYTMTTVHRRRRRMIQLTVATALASASHWAAATYVRCHNNGAMTDLSVLLGVVLFA